MFSAPFFVSAQTKISLNIPGTNQNASSTPGAFVANFYEFALMIGGVLAFGVVVYGGIKYMASAGNPSGQGDAKEWIEAALLGLVLLVGAYFILKVVNPQLLNLSLPTLTPVNIATQTAGNGGSGNGSGSSSATGALINSILVKSGAVVAGLKQGITNALNNLKQACGSVCNVTITAGTDGTHHPGEYSHSNGYKADLRLDNGLNSYITSHYTDIGTRSDGAEMYKDPSTGAIYAREGSHWDVVSKK